MTDRTTRRSKKVLKSFENYFLFEQLNVGGERPVFIGSEYRSDPLIGVGDKIQVVRQIPLSLFKNEEEFKSFKIRFNQAHLFSHGSFITHYQLHKTEDCVYMILEFVHGRNLLEVQDRLKENGFNLPLQLTINTAIQLLDTLHYVHTYYSVNLDKMNAVQNFGGFHKKDIIFSFDDAVKMINFCRPKPLYNFELLAGRYNGVEGAGKRLDYFCVGLILFDLLTGSDFFDETKLDPVKLMLGEQEFASEVGSTKKIPDEIIEIMVYLLNPDEQISIDQIMKLRGRLIKILFQLYPNFANQEIGTFTREIFRKEFEKSLENLKFFGEIDITDFFKKSSTPLPARSETTQVIVDHDKSSLDIPLSLEIKRRLIGKKL